MTVCLPVTSAVQKSIIFNKPKVFDNRNQILEMAIYVYQGPQMDSPKTIHITSRNHNLSHKINFNNIFLPIFQMVDAFPKFL
jgi:hypothetical protein